MTEAIIVALITGAVSIIGSVISAIVSAGKNKANLKASREVTDYKITELTREVREHNNFARRVPIVEEQIRNINHRLEDLERKDA